MVVNLISVPVFNDLLRNNRETKSGISTPDDRIMGTCLPWGIVRITIYIHQANRYAHHPLSNSSGVWYTNNRSIFGPIQSVINRQIEPLH